VAKPAGDRLSGEVGWPKGGLIYGVSALELHPSLGQIPLFAEHLAEVDEGSAHPKVVGAHGGLSNGQCPFEGSTGAH
jgi:hypothetical protein